LPSPTPLAMSGSASSSATTEVSSPKEAAGNACPGHDRACRRLRRPSVPKGPALRILIEELAANGIKLKASSFDALALPKAIDLSDRTQVQLHLPEITFIEIKTANQPRVQPGFKGFFFALTESEISAADQLGARYRVALFNKLTGELLLTSVPQIISRTTSMNWQLSVQL
jgi:hypothetical protein